MTRSMEYVAIYGIDHPSWMRPECFLYPTAEKAAAAIQRAYGANSAHIVVRVEPAALADPETETDQSEEIEHG